tara:strand:- start:110 stop:451 length:342 start_codon:yes stop_codon:yes gene_type:complete
MKTPIMDESGVIQFPAPTLDVDQFASDIDSAYRAAQAAWQSRDVAEIDATDVALDLARDLIATMERRELFFDGTLRGPAGQAVDLLIEYVIWRKNRADGDPTPAKFTGEPDGS